MTLALVTGSNRGIGLSLTRLLSARGVHVVAVCRTSSPALDALAQAPAESGPGVEVVSGVDVTSEEAPARLLAVLGDRPLDLLVNNAGILVWETKLAPDLVAAAKQFEVNALAPLRLTLGLRPRLRAGSKVAMITSRMGSIGDNTSGGAYGYRMSKAALNIASRSLAIDLAPEGVLVAVLHPGMVSTDMIGGRGQIEPDDAAAQLLTRIDALDAATSGAFLHANGQPLPW